MIFGTTPPDEHVSEAFTALWHRERVMLESLRRTKRSRRNAALEIMCSCPKSHLVVSVFSLPNDEVAVWFHGGGWMNESSIGFPQEAELSRKYREAGLSANFTAADVLDIRDLASLRNGTGLIGRVVPRCSPPHTISATDRTGIAEAIDQWRAGSHDAPIRAILE